MNYGVIFGWLTSNPAYNFELSILNRFACCEPFKIISPELTRANTLSPSVGHLARLIAPSENKVQVEFGKARVVGPDIILSVNNTLKKQGKKPL